MPPLGDRGQGEEVLSRGLSEMWVQVSRTERGDPNTVEIINGDLNDKSFC